MGTGAAGFMAHQSCHAYCTPVGTGLSLVHMRPPLTDPSGGRGGASLARGLAHPAPSQVWAAAPAAHRGAPGLS